MLTPAGSLSGTSTLAGVETTDGEWGQVPVTSSLQVNDRGPPHRSVTLQPIVGDLKAFTSHMQQLLFNRLAVSVRVHEHSKSELMLS